MRLRLRFLSIVKLTLLFSLNSGLPPAVIYLNAKTLAQPPTNQNSKAEIDLLLQKGIEQYQNRQYKEALETYQQVLTVARAIDDKATLGEALHRIGAIYNNLDNYSQAVKFFEQSLTIRKEINDQTGVGSTLNSMGGVYQQQGRYEEALRLYQQSLAIRREMGYKAGEGRTLNNIASVYDAQGQYAQAIETYQQALTIFKQLNNKTGVAALLSNIGLIYSNLGQYEQALQFYQQSLALRKEIGDKAGIGKTLHNIGFTYNKMGQNSQALNLYQQALVVRREIKDKVGEATTLNNLGFLYDQLGHYPKAIESLEQALAVFKQIGNRPGVGRTLDSIGTVYKSLGQYPKSLAYYKDSLAIQREVGDRAGEREILGNIGSTLHKQNQPELAIIFYKQSVNVTEAIRKDIKTLSRDQQESYTKTVANNYRSLADILLKQNRVQEAQQVIDLLKIQELDDYSLKVLGNKQTSLGMEILPAEEKLLANYQSSQQFDEFTRRPDVVALVQQLNQKTGGQNLNLKELNNIQEKLRRVQQAQTGGVPVLIYPLILEDRLELVLVTPDSPPIHRTVQVKREDLNQIIADFQIALTDTEMRYRFKKTKQAAYKLYDLLIKPIENDLKKANAQTIIYAPDGQLRYVPLAALHDGEQWLVERFRINNITAASLTNFDNKPQTPRVLAGAFTKGSYNVQVGKQQFLFSGLPFAGQEVEDLAAKIPDSKKLLDDDFSPNNTISRMSNYSILHLATHAQFVDGQPEDSFILFGEGSYVALSDIAKWSLPNVDLVVLSACQTAVGGELGDGKEILGLGYQIQQTGAKAAIASLWSVEDASTQILMNAFYSRLLKGNITKTEALRQAQIDLITGNSLDESQQNLEHPYHWASFILIGNGL